MNNMEFITAFEQGTLHHFPHHAHVRMAWIYLRKEGWEEGKTRISQGLRHLTVAHGAPGKYHETITMFWARLVKHAIDAAPKIEDYEVFATAFPFLFDGKAINHHFSSGLLASDEARQHWVEPDLKPMPM